MREVREKLRLCPAGAGIGDRMDDSEETEAPWFNSRTGTVSKRFCGKVFFAFAFRVVVPHKRCKAKA